MIFKISINFLISDQNIFKNNSIIFMNSKFYFFENFAEGIGKFSSNNLQLSLIDNQFFIYSSENKVFLYFFLFSVSSSKIHFERNRINYQNFSYYFLFHNTNDTDIKFNNISIGGNFKGALIKFVAPTENNAENKGFHQNLVAMQYCKFYIEFN